MAIHTLSMFAGGGMLDIGIELAFGPIFRPIAYVECEAHAVAVLVAAMESGRLHQAPVWSDARTVCGPQFCHYVREAGGIAAIVGGYPCPDFSCAGRRAGLEGDKGALWWSLADAIEAHEPELLFLENVGGHTSKGFDTVSRSIRDMGYRIAAGLFTAAEVGASQGRERLFIMAHSARAVGESGSGRRGVCEGSEELEGPASGKRRSGREAPGDNRRSGKSDSDIDGPGKELEHASGIDWRRGVGGEKERAWADRCRRRGLAGAGSQLAGTEGVGVQGLRSARIPEHGASSGEGVLGRYSLPLFPPHENNYGEWQRVLSIAPSLEPEIYKLADGMADRAQQLRLLGNGVVPLEAAYAYTTLAACLWGEPKGIGP